MPDRASDTLLTGLGDLISVVVHMTCCLPGGDQMTSGFHVLDGGMTRIRNRRKSVAGVSISVSASVLKPPPTIFIATSEVELHESPARTS
ncbi:MAG: hypothetical protein WB239_12105 [Acidimicrobiia bacterium]